LARSVRVRILPFPPNAIAGIALEPQTPSDFERETDDLILIQTKDGLDTVALIELPLKLCWCEQN